MWDSRTPGCERNRVLHLLEIAGDSREEVRCATRAGPAQAGPGELCLSPPKPRRALRRALPLQMRARPRLPSLFPAAATSCHRKLVRVAPAYPITLRSIPSLRAAV